MQLGLLPTSDSSPFLDIFDRLSRCNTLRRWPLIGLECLSRYAFRLILQHPQVEELQGIHTAMAAYQQSVAVARDVQGVPGDVDATHPTNGSTS